MPEYYSQNNPTMGGFGGNQNASYDLNEEKKAVAEITEEIKKELLEKWKKAYANAQIFPAAVAAMHPDAVNFLLEFARVAEYDEIARVANLNQEQRNILPQIVWQVAISKNWAELPKMINENLAVNPAMVATILQNLEQKIVGKIKALAEKPFVQRAAVDNEPIKKDVALPLLKALEEYPKLGEQQITSNVLKLKYFPEPVRPSIKNWITDYHDNMGQGKHEVMDRGNFLFHSANGKVLTAGDRQKLTMVLRALDDNTPVQIDPVRQTLMFVDTNEPRINHELTTNNPVPSAPSANNIPPRTVTQDFKLNVEPVAKPVARPPRVDERTSPRVEAGPYVPAPAPRPYVSPVPAPIPAPHPNIPAPIKQTPPKQPPVVDLKKQPERVMTAVETKSQAAYPQVGPNAPQANPLSGNMQRASRYEGGLSISRGEEKEIFEPSAPAPTPLIRPEETVGYRTQTSMEAPKEASPDVRQKDEKVASIFEKGIGVGSENYFANFSSQQPRVTQNNTEENDNVKGEVAFAAPQQFQAEQTRPMQPAAREPKQTPPVAPHPHVPYMITPMEDKYTDEDISPKDDGPKINGNIVDLKN